jgi:hypothetical protein
MLRTGDDGSILLDIMRIRTIYTVGILIVLMAGTAWGQAGEKTEPALYAEIVYVQGDDIVVLSGGRQKALSSPLGERLYRGDQIQTGGKTTAELVLMPRKSRLRLAENTVVTISELTTDGATGIELVYGRLRSKVASIVDRKESFNVKASNVVAAVRGTDFGCDMVLDPSGRDAPTKVYCFDGSVAVSALSLSETSIEPLVVESGAMAIVSPASAKGAFEIQKTTIDEDTRTFWKSNDFTEKMPVGVSASSTLQDAPAALEPMPLPSFDFEALRKGLTAKNSAIIGSTVLVAIGAALGGTAYFLRDTDPELSDRLLFTGALTAAVSIPSLVLAVSIDPLKSVGKK